jgi:hypothetical protein
MEDIKKIIDQYYEEKLRKELSHGRLFIRSESGKIMELTMDGLIEPVDVHE